MNSQAPNNALQFFNRILRLVCYFWLILKDKSWSKDFIWVLCFLCLIGCGRSIYRSFEKDDPAEEATIALEENNPDKAIKILEEALEEEPTNYKLTSLLSMATAQKYEIDLITIAIGMAENEGSNNQSSSSSNDIVRLFSAVPEPNSTNLAGLARAITLLESIPQSQKTKADNFKLIILHTTNFTMTTKRYDADRNGALSTVELLEMSDNDAVAILGSLLGAEGALAKGAETTGDSSRASTANISTIRTAINTQEGTTDAEKLRNYLGSSD